MRVIGIDFGTTSGYAWTDTGKVDAILSGEWKLGGNKHEGGGMRYARFEALLRELIEKSPGFDSNSPSVAVFYEIAPPMRSDPSKGRATSSSREVWGAFLGVTQSLCERLGVPYLGITVSDVKRRATGKGNSGKDLLVEASRKTFGAVIGDDEHNRSDALWILQVGLDDLRPEGWAQ